MTTACPRKQLGTIDGGGPLVSIMTITFQCTSYRNVDTQSGLAPIAQPAGIYRGSVQLIHRDDLVMGIPATGW